MANPISAVTGLQAGYNTASGSNIATTAAAITLVAGDQVFLFVGTGGTQGVTSVSDNTGGAITWSSAVTESGSLTSSRRLHVWQGVANTSFSGSPTFTANFSAASVNRSIFAVKVSGMSAPLINSFDKSSFLTPTATAVNGTSNGTDYNYTADIATANGGPGPLTPSRGDEIVFFVSSLASSTSGTTTRSFTNSFSALNSPFVNFVNVGYYLQGDTPASVTTASTWSAAAASQVIEYGLLSYPSAANLSDTGSGTDTASVVWGIPVSDAAQNSATDTASVVLGFSVSDAPQAQGADTASSSMAIPVADAPQSNATDTASLSSSIPAADAPQAQGTDVASLSITLTGSDSGSGTDTLALNRGLFDTGSGTDSASVTIVLTPFAYDTGSGNDSSGVTIVETISAGDSGGGADAAVAYIPKPYFTPPLVKDIAPYLPDSSGLQVRLFRHYATRYRGVNVYLLSDGTFVQDTATPENTNSGYPLPWILNNDPTKIGWNPPSYVNGQIVYGPEVSWPTGALPNTYSTVYNIDGTVTTTALSPYIAKIYEGSHTHAITQDEAVALMAAGYTVEYV
jgi:hypothetical protein